MGDGSAPCIVVDGLELALPGPDGTVIRVLGGVSLGIEPAEFLCVLGPSGCGKTTLLNCIAGFLRPSAGRVLIAGAPVEGTRPEVGIVFQEHALFPWSNDQACFKTFERAQALGVPVLVHAGLIYCNPDDPAGTKTKYCMPIHLDDVAREFPSLKLVVAHGGRPFVEQTIALSLMPNVYVDVSWSLLPLTMWPALVAPLLEAFGPDRIIYGSDANWREPSRLATRLAECRRLLREVLKVDATTEAKILGGNAERLLGDDPGWRIITEAIRTQ